MKKNIEIANSIANIADKAEKWKKSKRCDKKCSNDVN